MGFEQMKPGALGSVYADRPSPFEDFDALADTLIDAPGVPLALRYFGGAGLAHMKKYGTKLDAFAKIRAKASRHAKNNPHGDLPQGGHRRRRDERHADLAGRDDAPDGLPADLRRRRGILVSETFARRHGLRTDVVDQGAGDDDGHPFHLRARKDMMRLVGYDMAKAAANKVYEQSGVGPEDIGVVELHDCFAQNELITYEALGLCPEGGAEAFIERATTPTAARSSPIRRAGLLSKGHPLGATGLAQCYELTRQLRGTAEATQVEGVDHALQHNLGLGGACVVTLYERM